MLKDAIFDFDGTLFDSMSIWDTIGENHLRSIGYEPKEKCSKPLAYSSCVLLPKRIQRHTVSR